jgi:hypothetical protein
MIEIATYQLFYTLPQRALTARGREVIVDQANIVGLARGGLHMLFRGYAGACGFAELAVVEDVSGRKWL